MLSSLRMRAAVLLGFVAAAPSAAADLGLGFWSRDLTRAEGAELAEGQPLGAMVTAVYPGGPAAAAGLLPFDRIVAVDGEEVLSDEGLVRRLGPAKERGAVRLTLVRGPERSEVFVLPAERSTYLGPACDAGEQMACMDLATAGGLGLEKYVGRSAELMRTACDAGNGEACTDLGYRRAKGSDGPADPAGGVALVDRACDAGHAEACRLLGSWTETGGFGLEASRERRAAYFEKGCAAGSRESCHLLALSLEAGDGVAQDLAAAAAAYEQACLREDEQCCIETARMVWNGFGVPRDRERAYRLYGSLCDRGEPKACHAFGKALLADAQGPRGAAVLEKSCERGTLDSCFLLGTALHEGNATLATDVRRSARFLGVACDAGHGHACFMLGFLYDAGPEYKANGLPKDEARAFQFYTRSCDLDYMVGCWHLGHSYATGEGVPLDPARGLVLLDKACRGGEDDACEWIEILKLR